ncbi:MAG: methyltransferase domain-containing protein [Proteobacteria bacterium]|nr:methyltransferase domain-containing protein [Pseudomonadota bacterium]
MHSSSDADTPFAAGYADGTIPVLVRRFGSWQVSLRRQALNEHELSRDYDRAAPRWHRALDRLGFPDAYEKVLRDVLRARAIPGQPRRVLDCGVGTGALSCALSRVSSDPFRLDAIDISPRMLEQAQGRFRDCDLRGTLCLGDIRELPYGDGIFDLVMSAHVLEHLADPNIALDEMIRVLKPGGVLVVCLTRRSLSGSFVNLKWRTHRTTPAQTERWLCNKGLEDVGCRSFGDRSLCRRLSVACIGSKPFDDIHAGAGTAGARPIDGEQDE